jgi:hypothetical protein
VGEGEEQGMIVDVIAAQIKTNACVRRAMSLFCLPSLPALRS